MFCPTFCCLSCLIVSCVYLVFVSSCAEKVAKTTLTRVDDVDFGRFNNGDVYLVMQAVHDISGDAGGGGGGGITRTLFYWVGSKASMDKGTVACIKAVELRRALPGPCSIRREDEGQESPEFLVMFDELTVAEDESGARVLSKVRCARYVHGATRSKAGRGGGGVSGRGTSGALGVVLMLWSRFVASACASLVFL